MEQADFLQLIQDNKGILFKISNSYCRNRDDREDLMQEIIYQLWKSAGGFDTNRKFSTWMYRIALNVAISYYRRQRRSGLRITFGGDLHLMELGRSRGAGYRRKDRAAPAVHQRTERARQSADDPLPGGAAVPRDRGDPGDNGDECGDEAEPDQGPAETAFCETLKLLKSYG